MKMVMALVKPARLDDIRDVLLTMGIRGMTISDVKGFGRQKGQTEIYQTSDVTVNFLPKIKIEIAADDKDVDQIVEAIRKTAYTGGIGDGKIFVYDLAQVMRIRTGESGAQAL